MTAELFRRGIPVFQRAFPDQDGEKPVKNSTEKIDAAPINKPEEELPVSWQKIQGAIWLLGLAILFWQNLFWPGILVLLGISGLTQGVIQLYLSRQNEQKEKNRQETLLAEERGKWLPATCPKCGGPISVATVQWTGPDTASCPYCQANLKRGA